MPLLTYSGYRFPPDIIQRAMWMYLRFTLSFRYIEELLAERGIGVTYESTQRRMLTFGPAIARQLRARRPKPHGRWHLDETSYEDGCVKLVLFSAGRHRPSPCVLTSMGAEVELRAARGALANLVSGGTASAPRSLIRVGG